MPEGDTVWRTARDLHDALAGEPLIRCDLRVPKLATVDLTGRDVIEVVARGKHLLTRFAGGLTLHSHLGMDGAWRIHSVGERRHGGGGPHHQIRAILANSGHTAVGYRLPVLDLLRTPDESTVVGHLGPDLLGPDWDAGEAVRRLLSDPGRTVGEALLDQRNLAGIGNVYKSELCFLLRISPWAPVASLLDPERLVALAKKLLEANKSRTARITTADVRADRRLWVYGRADRPCRRCGSPVLRTEQGPAGQERITYWCPHCQTGPPPLAPPGPDEPNE
ncbi:DNA glycosylase [Streptomyces cinnamoneus]|uniref:DNA-(apurinic or apyrimidinic site) lyase n=1 Tax=Streptomyces cinnamoneus TaxID=53446 RepID=A0A2G1XAT5_STRCJ|nr:DNA-formamidopyrimidine glycosylase family protein [Streptomyces cinnamoneus]PHQ48325.1 DNA glycosylase [Streptomyces cinnamoneus]PPT16749.1 Fpg/Nei family DNA glycosylase [Streptomyces cinnamoneus]